MNKRFWISLIILALLDGVLSLIFDYGISWWHGAIAFVLAYYISTTLKTMKSGVHVGKFKKSPIVSEFEAYILKGNLDCYVKGHFYRYENDEYKVEDMQITKSQLIVFLNGKEKEVEEFLRKNKETPGMQGVYEFDEEYNTAKEISLSMKMIK